MLPEMEKSYNHHGVEKRVYEKWESEGYFRAQPDSGRPPFTIVMPPPNITGQLHMGHALDNTMQDILIRFKRMQGFEALWMPGTDHASIATEAKIVQQLAEQGLSKADMSRDEFLSRAWKWREEFGTRIVHQLRRLGSSCDWERERFTMDEGCSKAVLEVFVRLYEKGLIYRGDRIINWCPVCKTSISDIEVEYAEQQSFLWHVRYDSPEGFSITVATTRPETILGDTAIAVNPDDKRYKHLVGKTVIVPGVGREIPIVADNYVEMDFGTGAVKITPAHDPNDFEVGQRCNVPPLRVMNDDATINENGGKYAGMDRYACREAFVEELKALGALVKVEPYAHNVGTCYRCTTTVEPLISKQWFVSMKPLAQPAIKAARTKDIKFIPERFEKTYLNWMENIHDWCISRQLWWGHRIPAYYCNDCEHMSVAIKAPKECPKCGGTNLRQDEDVLDTWFSSGLWPFSTLGYPEKTPELDYFYPTTTLVTGYDIIFFWVARMIVFGLEVMGKRPFENVLVHGIVRDPQGRKMSKSLGNGIDPLEVIEKHGADALRFSLVTGNSPGNDMRFYWEKAESCGNFCNKVYNASRFVLMNIGESAEPLNLQALDLSDKWLFTRLNQVIGEITANLEAYDLGMAAQKLYDFIWSEFCDWYIELAKPRLYEGSEKEQSAARAALRHALLEILKLLHPFMPFISEEIYAHVPGAGETIMREAWPTAKPELNFEAEARAMQGIMEIIRAVRNVRAEMNVPPSRKAKLMLLARSEEREALSSATPFLLRLAAAQSVSFIEKSDIPQDAVAAICPMAEVYMPLEDLVDIAKERERIAKERERLQGEIDRAASKLGNEAFMAKAPEKVKDEEKRKLAEATELLAKLNERAAALG